MQVKICLGCVYLTKLIFSKKNKKPKTNEKQNKPQFDMFDFPEFLLWEPFLTKPQKRLVSPPRIKPGNLSLVRQMSKPEVLSLCVWTFVFALQFVRSLYWWKLLKTLTYWLDSILSISFISTLLVIYSYVRYLLTLGAVINYSNEVIITITIIIICL